MYLFGFENTAGAVLWFGCFAPAPDADLTALVDKNASEVIVSENDYEGDCSTWLPWLYSRLYRVRKHSSLRPSPLANLGIGGLHVRIIRTPSLVLFFVCILLRAV